MKSSKDVPPRVGMQFYASFDDEFPRRRIIDVRGDVIFTDVDGDWPGGTADMEIWSAGKYKIEWTPPTDEERQMFLEIAKHARTGYGECPEFCEWAWRYETNDGDVVAESLALDGADYDNMPAGWK